MLLARNWDLDRATDDPDGRALAAAAAPRGRPRVQDGQGLPPARGSRDDASRARMGDRRPSVRRPDLPRLWMGRRYPRGSGPRQRSTLRSPVTSISITTTGTTK